jgi:hypothetical protein
MTAIDRPITEKVGGFLLERAVAFAGALGEDALRLAGIVGSVIDVSGYLDRFDHTIEAGFPYDGPDNL